MPQSRSSKKPRGTKPPKGRKPLKGHKPPKLSGPRLRWYLELGKHRRRRALGMLPPATRFDELLDDATLMDNIVWHPPSGGAEPYPAWDSTRKEQLRNACDGILEAGTGQGSYRMGLPAAPPLKFTPSGAETPFTFFDLAIAWNCFLGHVAQSLVVEAARWVPWSLRDYSNSDLAMLLDSGSLFYWYAPREAYVIGVGHGRATPGDPFRTYAFLETNYLIGTNTQGTIEQVLGWCHANLRHFLDEWEAANALEIWQYAGAPPVERMLSGTTSSTHGFAHWTAGCWGTTGFLSAVLRTVNIPVRLDVAGGHALPYFVREALHLSHGDDPYDQLGYATPPMPMSEILIDDATFQAWFGPQVPYDAQRQNVGRRMVEVAPVYLPNYLLRKHCEDLQRGTDHAHSQVRNVLSHYSLEYLEAAGLWESMDAKIASFGGCDRIPARE